MSQKLAAFASELEGFRKRQVSLSTTVDKHDDDIKTVLGKLDDLEHQLNEFRKETKNNLASVKKGEAPNPQKTAPPVDDQSYEAPYKDAFDSFQKGNYEEAAKRLTAFAAAFPNAPVVPNALFWLGESHMMLKDYDKAILDFQELLDKYPKSSMAPKALLSQADAFAGAKDKKAL